MVAFTFTGNAHFKKKYISRTKWKQDKIYKCVLEKLSCLWGAWIELHIWEFIKNSQTDIKKKLLADEISTPLNWAHLFNSKTLTSMAVDENLNNP